MGWKETFEENVRKAQAGESWATTDVPTWMKEIQAQWYYEAASPEEQESLTLEFPGVFEALTGQPIPKVKQDKSWWDKGPVGFLKDRAGNVWSSALDALTWPADRIEQVINYPLTYLWTNDVPDGYSRWDLASLGWDINLSYFAGGLDEPGKRVAQLNMEMAKGTQWEEIEKKISDPWLDLPGKVLLDPLWLIGGAGPIAKVPGAIGRKLPVISKLMPTIKGGEKAFTAAKMSLQLENRAHNLERFADFTSQLSDIKLAVAARETATAGRVTAKSLQLGPVGKIIEFGVIGGGEAPINVYNLAAKVRDYPIIGKATRIAANLLGPKPTEMAQFDYVNQVLASAGARAQALRTGNSRFPILGWLQRITKTRPAFHFMQTRNEFETLMSVLTRRADGLNQSEMGIFLDGLSRGADGIAGLPATLHAKLPREYLESPLGRELADIFRDTGLTLDDFPSLTAKLKDPAAFRPAFFKDFDNNFAPALQTLFGIPEKGSGEKLLGTYKTVLSMTTLNSPSFVVLNAVNNVATLFADYGISMFRGGWTLKSVERHLAELGEDAGLITRVVRDSSIRQMFGTDTEAFSKGWRAWLAPWVNISAKIDGWARLKAWQIGRQRGIRAASTLLDLPPNFSSMPRESQEIINGFIDGLASGGGMANFDEALTAISAGYRPNIGYILGKQWAREYWMGADERMLGLATEHLDPVFREISDVFTRSGGNPDRLWNSIMQLQQDLIYHTEYVRAANMLQPVGDIAKVADTPGTVLAHAGLAVDRRGQAAVELYKRALLANGIPESVIDEAMNPMVAAFYGSRANRKYVDDLVHATPDMVERGLIEPEEWERLQSVGTHGLWKEYEARRISEFSDAYDHLMRTIDEHAPDALKRMLRVANRNHIELLHQHDTMRTLAMRQKETWKRGGVLSPIRAQFDEYANQNILELEQTLGLRMEKEIGYPAADAMPSMAEAITLQNMHAQHFIDWAIPRLQTEMAVPRAIPAEFMEETLDWFSRARGTYRDMEMIGTRVGNRMADWTMLNYNAYGSLDTWLMWVMPYHFWPVRSMARWAQRGMANPGLMSIMADVENLKEEMTKGLPERFGGQIQIPIPFMGDAMENLFGMSGRLFFDPIQVMFPVLAWQEDFSYESRQNTVAGKVLDWWGNNGPGVSPFVPLIGSWTGVLDKNEWLTRNWPRSLPLGLPGTPAQMGIIAWLEGDDRINIDSLISEEEQIQLLKGNGLPLAAVQRVLGMEDDDMDRYRIDRAMSDLVVEKVSKISDQEERQELVDEYKRAMLDPDHPLWKEARNFASKEYGIRSLTSWLFMPVSMYPDGESKARALQDLYQEFAKQGMLEEFYERFPEHQIRQIAMRNFESKEERDAEAKRAVFFLDIENANQVLERDKIERDNMLNQINSDPAFFQTKMGRWYADMIKEEYAAKIRDDQKMINEIYAFAGDSLDIPSYDRTPMERALSLVGQDYYKYDLQDFLPSGKTIETASDDEIHAATDRMWEQRDEFLAALPTQKIPTGLWAENTARYYAADLLAQQQGARLAEEGRWDEREKVLDQARSIQDEITEWAKGAISRPEFNEWLVRNQEPPSELQALYEEARQQMSTYRAMADDLNWPDEVSRQYWKDNPLLTFFYGNEPSPWEMAAPMEYWETIARIDQIRTSYYDKPGIRQLDYLSMVYEELNILLSKLGLPLVELDRTREGRWDLRLPGTGIPTLEEVEARL